MLVPARRRPRRERPPEGSKIAVERRGDRTVYTWDPRSRDDLVAAALIMCMIVTAPLALWILWRRRRYRSASVAVSPDTIEFTGHGWAPVRARRDEVGAIRVSTAPGGRRS